jgi:sugar O-acyltransferase (sialic acid O-acetyltransferase NeuD family)
MPDLLILGDGPHAVEMLGIVDRVNRVENAWNILGFVSVHPGRVGETLAGFPVLGMPQALEQHAEAFVVPEYEWPHKADLPRDRLASLIDPSVFVSCTAHIGLGCVIYPNCYVGSHARVGDFLFCLSGSVINHNNIIEDDVTLTSGVVIAGDVHVETGCYFGQSCTVRELLRIGRGSLIGMGSVVLHDVPPNSVMVGNPARRLRAREPKTLAERASRKAKWTARKGAHKVYRIVSNVGARLFRPAAESTGGTLGV